MPASAIVHLLVLVADLAVLAPLTGRYLSAVYSGGVAPGDRVFGWVERVYTDHFSIDLVAGRVTDTSGQPVHLTPKEWGIVAALARRPDWLVMQRELLHDVWRPQHGDEGNCLRVFIAHRKKLEPDPHRPRYFVTEPGFGYRLAHTRDSDGPRP